MSGDAPVRICEGLEVKFLWSTHLPCEILSFVSGRMAHFTEVHDFGNLKLFT